MRSVPPRGSGWVIGLPIVDCRFQIHVSPKAHPQSQIDNRLTHPLPRGGTDLIQPPGSFIPVQPSGRANILTRSELDAFPARWRAVKPN